MPHAGISTSASSGASIAGTSARHTYQSYQAWDCWSNDDFVERQLAAVDSPPAAAPQLQLAPMRPQTEGEGAVEEVDETPRPNELPTRNGALLQDADTGSPALAEIRMASPPTPATGATMAPSATPSPSPAGQPPDSIERRVASVNRRVRVRMQAESAARRAVEQVTPTPAEQAPPTTAATEAAAAASPNAFSNLDSYVTRVMETGHAISPHARREHSENGGRSPGPINVLSRGFGNSVYSLVYNTRTDRLERTESTQDQQRPDAATSAPGGIFVSASAPCLRHDHNHPAHIS